MNVIYLDVKGVFFMAIESDVVSVSIVNRLNNGLDDSGNVKTVTLSLPKINETYYGANLSTSRVSAIAVSNALSPLLAKPLYSVREVMNTNLREID